MHSAIGPEPLTTEVRMLNGAPALFINGRPDSGLMFWHTKPDVGREEIERFAEQGVRLVSTGFSASGCLREDGSCDFSHVDRMMERVLAGNPGALVLPRVGLMPPAWWAQAHPEELQWESPDGKTRRPWAAFPSPAWREQLATALPAFVRYAEERYGDRFFGYHVGDGDCTEWSYTWGATRGDFGPAQTAAFRAWLRERYGNDPALQKAWAMPDVTLDTALVPAPVPAIWMQTPRVWTLYRPDTERAHIDYLEFHSQAAADAVLRACRLAKATLKELGRNKVCGVFYGYHFWELGMPYLHVSGHQALERVLESPDVDFFCAPETYQERQPGRMFLSQLPTASLRLHGKLFYNEEDTYTHRAKKADASRYCCPDAEVTNRLLRRNLLGALREGGTQWWMDLDGETWYLDPAVLEEVGRLRGFADQALQGDRRSCAQVAVIISEASQPYLRYGPAFSDAALGRQISELTSLGAPFDVYCEGDLERLFSTQAGEQYRLVVFLDSVYLTSARRETIRRVVARGGRTLLWPFACGLVDETGVSVDAMSDLIGIRLAMRDHVGPLLVEAFEKGERLTYGTDRDMGPHLHCEDPAAKVSGWILHRGDPGLVEKNLPDSKAVWSAAPAVPAPVLKRLAREAGVHLYSEANDQVFAAYGWLGLHAAVPGERIIRLPAPATVRDAFSGAVLAKGRRAFTVTLERGETRAWWITRPVPRSASPRRGAQSPAP